MLSICAIAAGVGFVLGRYFRAPALLAASYVLIAGGALLACFGGLTFSHAFMTTCGALVAMHAGYLLALVTHRNHTR